MSTRAEQEKRVFARIDELEDELIKVALDLSNIDRDKLVYKDEAGFERRIRDTIQHEKLGAEYVHAWLEENGFDAKRQGAPNRPNILGTYRGTGNGRSVLFNSHLDVGTRLGIELKLRDPNLAHRIGAWREGDDLVGQGIVNCKGPMACWLIMAKALKDTGVQLAGDVLLSSVVGETGGAPVDEFESPQWDSHEVGARYVASHGGIADYVVVAEATGFGIVPAMTGGAYFKVTTLAGPTMYTPFLERTPAESMATSHNAVLRMGNFMERFEEYATEYTIKNTYDFDGGTMVPNAHIGAIRGGTPPWPVTTTEICSVYCDFIVVPGYNPLEIQRGLESILADMGTEGMVEMYKFLPGYEGWHNEGFETLRKAVVDAHTSMFNQPPPRVPPKFVSMWRDLNPYNEIGVPAVSFGMPTGYTQEGTSQGIASAVSARARIADMVAASKMYASIALDLCNRPASQPL